MYQTATISGLREILNQYGLFPKKRWGQNFLVDRNILTKIADQANTGKDQYVVEIGPGLGALTEHLAQNSRGVLAIEIDTSLKPALEQVLSPYSQVKICFADILKVNIEQELMERFGLDNIPDYVVCANIPYNITTPIIFKLLEECSHMQKAILMMQKEVAGRILARPDNKEYGLLTLMTSYYAEVSLLMQVSRNCFYPRPEVDSSVIQLMPLPSKRVEVPDEILFKNFLRSAFQKRRKTLLNICSSFFSIDKNLAQDKLNQAGIKHCCRPENLNLEDYAQLFRVFLE